MKLSLFKVSLFVTSEIVTTKGAKVYVQGSLILFILQIIGRFSWLLYG